jgi:hypothetical protein
VLLTVRARYQGLLQRHQDAHAIFATGKLAQAAVFDKSAVLCSSVHYKRI